MTRRVRTAVLISGGGSNMRALVEASRAADYPADIVLVVSNEPQAGGLVFAREQGIAVDVIDHRDFTDRDAFDKALDGALTAHNIELVACAGFMRILTPSLVDKWAGRMLNIHPSLLPDFKGLHTHARALAAGVAEHGCTVHHVTSELDGGPVIMQARVPVMEGDDAETLAARVLKEEHRIYPLALEQVARAMLAEGL